LPPPAVLHDVSQKDNEALTEAERQHIFSQDLQNDTSHDPPHYPLPQAESFNSEGNRGTHRKRSLSFLSSSEVVSEDDMRPLKRLKSSSAGQTQPHGAFQGHEAVGSFEDLVHFSELLTILLSSPGPFVHDSQAWYGGSLAQSPTTASNNVFANANNTIPLDPRLSCYTMPATSHPATTLIQSEMISAVHPEKVLFRRLVDIPQPALTDISSKAECVRWARDQLHLTDMVKEFTEGLEDITKVINTMQETRYRSVEFETQVRLLWQRRQH
jgi:hypothetical protein